MQERCKLKGSIAVLDYRLVNKTVPRLEQFSRLPLRKCGQ
jgi:hypothetical protein